ncbi:tyrosine-type recombinase/integrase [Streptomyces sp. NPDC000618]|uniref:tyrosine-type recombinase/integrase n=1 Tax=Streptomyces sp. NPDC000618 TaxID=3154265 RepID=UPI003320EA2C
MGGSEPAVRVSGRHLPQPADNGLTCSYRTVCSQISEGKGGHQRLIPVSAQFFGSVGDYLDRERPPVEHDRLFVVLRGPTRGRPLSADGLDEILDGVRKRTGLPRLTCHQLRHTCLTQLREAGMALEAVQAQAGHRSIESTRIYIHLANAWLVEQYLEASAAIDADRVES